MNGISRSKVTIYILLSICIYMLYIVIYIVIYVSVYCFSPRFGNTGLVSSGASLTSWGEGASLALVGHPSSDGVTIKTPYGVDVLH